SRASPGHSASACFSIASSPRTLVSWRAVSAFTASNSRRARPAAASATNGITSATTNEQSPRSPMTLYRIRSSMPSAPDGERRSYTPPRPGTTSPLGVTCPSVNLLVGGGLAQRALGFAQRGGLALGRLRREVDLLQQPALAVVVDVRVVRALVSERGEALGELPLLGRFAIVDAPQILRPADDVGREHDQQIRFRALLRAILKQPPEQRDVAEDGNLVDRLRLRVFLQAAEHHRVAVAHDDGGLDRALVGDRPAGIRQRLAVGHVGDLAVDLEPHRLRLVQVRRQLELERYVLLAVARQQRRAAGARH